MCRFSDSFYFQVLDLFNTHFDFQDIRRDFIHGVLAEEVMDDKIRVHVTSQGYAARVKDFRTYDSLSKDIIRRWTHPFVPDNNVNGLTTYQLHRNNVYKESGVDVARSATIDRNSVIGSGTRIGENTFIRDSVIGRNCTIGTAHCCTVTNTHSFQVKLGDLFLNCAKARP